MHCIVFFLLFSLDFLFDINIYYFVMQGSIKIWSQTFRAFYF